MGIADASEAARVAAQARWGNQVAMRAAAIVVERADQLDPDVREQVHEATSDPEDTDG